MRLQFFPTMKKWNVFFVEDANPHTHKATMETEGLKTSFLLRKAKHKPTCACKNRSATFPEKQADTGPTPWGVMQLHHNGFSLFVLPVWKSACAPVSACLPFNTRKVRELFPPSRGSWQARGALGIRPGQVVVIVGNGILSLGSRTTKKRQSCLQTHKTRVFFLCIYYKCSQPTDQPKQKNLLVLR